MAIPIERDGRADTSRNVEPKGPCCRHNLEALENSLAVFIPLSKASFIMLMREARAVLFQIKAFGCRPYVSQFGPKRRPVTMMTFGMKILRPHYLYK